MRTKLPKKTNVFNFARLIHKESKAVKWRSNDDGAGGVWGQNRNKNTER